MGRGEGRRAHLEDVAEDPVCQREGMVRLWWCLGRPLYEVDPTRTYRQLRPPRAWTGYLKVSQERAGGLVGPASDHRHRRHSNTGPGHDAPASSYPCSLECVEGVLSEVRAQEGAGFPKRGLDTSYVCALYCQG